ncbi:hypothetical protein JCM10295v2_006437 [Rhodotorula toruloides]
MSNEGKNPQVSKKLEIPQLKERVEWKGKICEQVEETVEKALYGALLGAEGASSRRYTSPMSCKIAYHRQPTLSNILLDDEVAKELAWTLDALKEVAAFSIKTDAVASAFAASFEYNKIEGTELLPTCAFAVSSASR